MITTLILDSDGVLYPTSQLNLRKITSALMLTLADFSISKDKWRECSYFCKKCGQPGMLNKLKKLCEINDIDEIGFQKAHAENIDYSYIQQNPELANYLLGLKKMGVTIVVASNNHRPHLEKVIDRVFGQSAKNIFSDIISGHSFQKTHSGGSFHILKPSRRNMRKTE